MDQIITYIVEPLKDMTMGVVHFLPTLLVSLAILIVGWIAARLITKLVIMLLRAVDFDKLSTRVGLEKVLKTGGIKEKPSSLLGCIFYWVMMIMVFVMTIKALKLTVAADLLDKLFSYIPQVVAGVAVLIVGMLIAKAVSTLIYIAAKNTDIPAPDVLSRVSMLAIMAYVIIMFLREVGFAAFFAEQYQIVIAGFIFAVALAAGLAGKDVLATYLHVLDKKPHSSHSH